jgi:hypothetical protein
MRSMLRSGPIAHCHCATCRKAHGSAFSSVSSVPRDKFRWTKGANLLASYESSPGKLRRFCSKCGSQIVAERAGQPSVILRLGCLDTPITDRPKAHIWRSQGHRGSIPRISFPSCRRASPNPSRRDHSVHPTLTPLREKNVGSASVTKKCENNKGIREKGK